jgi:hypothetical protein
MLIEKESLCFALTNDAFQRRPAYGVLQSAAIMP